MLGTSACTYSRTASEIPHPIEFMLTAFHKQHVFNDSKLKPMQKIGCALAT